MPETAPAAPAANASGISGSSRSAPAARADERLDSASDRSETFRPARLSARSRTRSITGIGTGYPLRAVNAYSRGRAAHTPPRPRTGARPGRRRPVGSTEAELHRRRLPPARARGRPAATVSRVVCAPACTISIPSQASRNSSAARRRSSSVSSTPSPVVPQQNTPSTPPSRRYRVRGANAASSSRSPSSVSGVTAAASRSLVIGVRAYPGMPGLLVIGGGIVGSATAFFAARRGFECTVLEARVGAGIVHHGGGRRRLSAAARACRRASAGTPVGAAVPAVRSGDGQQRHRPVCNPGDICG